MTISILSKLFQQIRQGCVKLSRNLSELFGLFLNWNIDCNSWRLNLSDRMKMFDNFNNLWHHNNTFNNFFNIISRGLNLNSSIVVLNKLCLPWNFKCFYFGLIYNNLSENFFRNFFFNKVFGLVDYFFNDFLDNFNLFLMMNFFFNFLNLVNKWSDRNVSVGLNFNRNLFVVNVMLRCVNFDKIRLLYDFGYVNRECSFMIFMDDLIHIEINFLRYLDRVLDLNGFFSQDLDLFGYLDILDSFRAWNLPNNLDFNRLLNFDLNDFRDCNSLCDRFLFLYDLRHFDNVLNYFFSNDRFLDNKFDGDLVLERNHNFSVLDSNFMNFD